MTKERLMLEIMKRIDLGIVAGNNGYIIGELMRELRNKRTTKRRLLEILKWVESPSCHF